MVRVRLTSTVWDGPIVGEAMRPPKVGRRFEMRTDEGKTVKTSKVVSEDGVGFVTESGARFRLEVLDMRLRRLAQG